MKTTREAAKQENHDLLVEHLQQLLEKNYDAEKGYKKAIKQSKIAELKNMFKKQAVMHNHFSTEIEKEIRKMNARTKENGSPIATLHRAFMDIRLVFTKKDDIAILEECIRAEKASIREYETRLKAKGFPAQTANVLQNQLKQLKESLINFKSLEDVVKNSQSMA